MNESDSERIVAVLEKQGYRKAKDIESADLIVINACSVRQSAIDRIFGLKQKFTRLKARKILTGCVLESDRKKFEEFFDEVLSIKEFFKRPLYSDRKKVVDYLNIKPKYKKEKSAFVPIMTGCDNYCTYCVVPYTRGREVSRRSEKIISEVKNLVSRGYKEITLLGQNVNSYEYGFAGLLKKLNDIPGVFTIKFLTNHPKDFSDELINIIAKCKKIAKEIHLPIQSGDDEILKKMNRGYTAKQYKDLVKKIRKRIPDVKLSTDVIVGFPGETRKQFENTVKLFKEIKFDKAYIAKYSPRAGTAAAKFKDDVSLKEKKRRWNILNELVNEKEKPKLIVVLGPTASGKSELAVKIAKKFSGEIISADSRQVYRGMDIGTGKITKREMEGIPHYLLDIASPKRQFTVVQYQKKALEAIKKIYKKKKIPIICGGTGFYIQALVEGLNIPAVKPDPKLRKDLEKLSVEELFRKLKKLDPRRAKNIDFKNRRRLIRALEIVIKTNKSVPRIKEQLNFDVLYLGIKKSMPELKKLIKKRLLGRLKKGMIAEVKRLKNPPAGRGISWKRLDDFGLEYRYIARYLREKLTKQEMINELQKEIERYAKRQMTWFKKYPGARVRWVRNYRQAEKLIEKFL